MPLIPWLLEDRPIKNELGSMVKCSETPLSHSIKTGWKETTETKWLPYQPLKMPGAQRIGTVLLSQPNHHLFLKWWIKSSPQTGDFAEKPPYHHGHRFFALVRFFLVSGSFPDIATVGPKMKSFQVAVSLWLGDFVTAKALLEEKFWRIHDLVSGALSFSMDHLN